MTWQTIQLHTFLRCIHKSRLAALFIAWQLPQALAAQHVCPPNIDFEFGSFQNWKGAAGSVAAVNGQNVISLSPTGIVGGRHTLLPRGSNLDPFGGFPVSCPNGSGYSILLGNSSTGMEAEAVTYELTIPAGANEYSLVYQYAVVFQESDHQDIQRPRFRASVFNVQRNSYIECSSFEYIANSSLPGFQTSPVKNDVLFKPWTPVTINLNGMAGQTIRLEFATADCTQGGHFGYAYLDVNTGCSNPLLGAAYCSGAGTVVLTAPYGYQSYQWFDAAGTAVGNQPTLPLTPAPANGTTYSVQVTPYPGCGCRDTMKAAVKAMPSPVSEAGQDALICGKGTVQIGSSPQSLYKYQWSPSAGLSSTTAANPKAAPASTTAYVLTTIDTLSGCSAADTVQVTVSRFDTALSVKGKTVFCGNEAVNALLSVSAGFMVQWLRNDQPAGSGTSLPVQAAGTYHALLSNTDGCVDSTRRITIASYPSPVARFTVPDTGQCLRNNLFSLVNGTAASNGETFLYNWNFGDGATASTADARHSYTAAGRYTVLLSVRSQAGCADTVNTTLTVFPRIAAAFTAGNGCIDVETVFKNSSSANAGYQWSFGDGTVSSLAHPLKTYTSTGTYAVQLVVTSPGCEQYPDTARQSLRIFRPEAGIRYPAVNAVVNKPQPLHARGFGRSYAWQPATFLSHSDAASPVFTGNRRQEYLVRITAVNGCQTTDTLIVHVYNTGGLYVPTAFTPNGDGRNDRLFPFLTGISQLISFKVINRWGNVMYQSASALPGWDGRYNGAPQPADGYVWEAEAIDGSGNRLREKGHVTLIR